MPASHNRTALSTPPLAADAEVKRLEGLRDSIEWGDGDGWFYGRAALEHGLRQNLMEAEWARRMVNAIDARAGS